MNSNSECGKVERIYSLYLNNPHITTDTRAVRNGDIFFALRGENFDGNKFALQAFEAGANYAVLSEKSCIPSGYEDKCIVVEDTLKTLQEVAALHRSKLKIPIIGITGTNGKTTTKELIQNVLSRKFKTSATKGNLNNHIGVPLTLLSITCDYEMAIVEMGASAQGEIAFLCNIARPTHGLITNIGYAHIEGFGSFESIIKTKCELLDFLEENNGFVFVNLDDANVAMRATKLHKTTYSVGSKADISVKLDASKPQASVLFDNIIINSNLVGGFNASNIAAALCVGRHFGLSDVQMAEAITNYVPENHRSQIRKTERNTLILDCYNANPSSVKAALDAFVKMNRPHKRVFLGAMKELGKASDSEHRHIVDFLITNDFEQIILVGEEYRELSQWKPNLLWFSTSSEARDYLLANAVCDCTILIKGSRATKMEIVEDAL